MQYALHVGALFCATRAFLFSGAFAATDAYTRDNFRVEDSIVLRLILRLMVYTTVLGDFERLLCVYFMFLTRFKAKLSCLLSNATHSSGNY